jgi:hypothetical protein
MTPLKQVTDEEGEEFTIVTDENGNCPRCHHGADWTHDASICYPRNIKHVCGRCPEEAEYPDGRYPGKPFDTFEELREHMLKVHGKEPEQRPAPAKVTDLRHIL